MDTGVRKPILVAVSALVIGASVTTISHAGDVGKTTLDQSWNTAAASRPFSATTGCREPVKGRHQRGAARAASLGSLQWFSRRCDRPKTKQALVWFQKENGLEPTATLDAHTMVAMFGNIGPSQGSSMPRNADQGTGE